MAVKISQKYQVVIPLEVRRALQIKPGMEVSVLAKGGVAYIVPVRSLEDVQKKMAGRFKTRDIKALREKKAGGEGP